VTRIVRLLALAAALLLAAGVARFAIAAFDRGTAAQVVPPAPQFKAAAKAATRGKARSLRIRVPRGVAAGDVMLAAVTVRSSRPPRRRAGWRLLRTDASSGPTQALYLRVAGREPSSYRWSFRSRASASGGIVAYNGVDNARPVDAHGGHVRRSTRRIPAPSLRTSVAGARVVGFFGSSSRTRLAVPLGFTPRFRTGTLAAADFVHAEASSTGNPAASVRRRTRRAIAQVVALRPGQPAPQPVPGVTRPPGYGSALPAPLPESTGAVFHVATNGSDSNPGSQAQPWATVQKALETLQPGQRAQVHAGTYTQALDLTRACTASAPCTVEGAPGEARPVLRITNDHVLRAESSAAYWRVRGFTFRDSNITSGGLVDLYGHHLEISDSELTAAGDQGFYLDEGSSNVQILRNWIHNSGLGRMHQSHGIYLQGNDHLVADNLIHDMPTGFGIQVYDKNSRSIIVHNTAVSNGHAGIVVGGSGGVDRIVVRNNIFAFNSTRGIQMDSTCPSDSVGDHNVLFGNGDGDVEGGCSGFDSSGGNIGADPLFADFGARNLHLKPGSPALNRAALAWSTLSDRDGEPRPQGSAADAGAYEDG
jgi:hypothetical protein